MRSADYRIDHKHLPHGRQVQAGITGMDVRFIRLVKFSCIFMAGENAGNVVKFTARYNQKAGTGAAQRRICSLE